MHFHKHHSTPEETEAFVQKLIDKSHVQVDPGEAKLIAKGAGIFHSRFSDPTTHAERKASWKKEIEEIKQRKHLQHEHGLHSSGSTIDLAEGSSAAAGLAHANTFPVASGDQNGPNPPTDCEEPKETQEDQPADNPDPETSDTITAEVVQGDSDSPTTAEELADESVAIGAEHQSPAANSPPTDSPVSNGSVTIETTSQICDVIRQLEEEHFFDPKNIASLPAMLESKLKEMGITSTTGAGIHDEGSSGAENVAEEGQNGEDEGEQEGQEEGNGGES